jgi:hypothetical protein
MATLNRMKNLRTYTLTAEEQQRFDPIAFTEELLSVGFKLDSVTCPVKITKPWDMVPGDNGAVIYRQWDHENLMDALGPFMVEIKDV